MEVKRVVSRSVIVDPIYDTFQAKSYDNHKKRLEEIKLKKTIEPAVMIKEYKEGLDKINRAKKAAQKMQERFSPSHSQTKSLVTHIETIINRKSDSLKILPRPKNSIPQTAREDINKSNKLLAQKIIHDQLNRVSKKDLIKQFVEYEEIKRKLRKVPDPIDKAKNKSNIKYHVNQ